jgi:hypothetical protein
MKSNISWNTIINRYTTLPFLFDMLYNKRLTLVDPENWEDENDSYFMRLYKARSGYRSVLALCFAEHETLTAEKYHNWKIYAGNSSGICIQFYKDKLVSYIENVSELRYGSAIYKTIQQFENEWRETPWSQLPFIKQQAFDGETEFRIIYVSVSEEIAVKYLPIKLNSIARIIVNPWLPSSLIDPIRRSINNIEGCEKIKVLQTKLLSYEKWKRAGNRVVKSSDNTSERAIQHRLLE